MSDELWRAAVGFEGSYEVSDQGRVRSLDRWIKQSRDRRRWFRAGRILAQSVSGAGYYRCRLSVEGKDQTVCTHKLVADAWCEKSGDSLEVNHKDGNKANNAAENLEWVTHTENNRHALANGLRRNVREQHNKAKFREEDVVLIRSSTESSAKLAEKYSVNKSTICRIKSGVTWSDKQLISYPWLNASRRQGNV